MWLLIHMTLLKDFSAAWGGESMIWRVPSAQHIPSTGIFAFITGTFWQL